MEPGEDVGSHASLDGINALDVDNWSDTFVQMASEIYLIKCIVAGDEDLSCFSSLLSLFFQVSVLLGRLSLLSVAFEFHALAMFGLVRTTVSYFVKFVLPDVSHRSQ